MNENTKHYLFVGVTIMFVLAFAYCISGRSDVHSDGDTAASVGKQIEQARDKQREINSGLQGAENAAGDITGSIERSAGAVSAAQNTAGSLEAAIEEQRVLIGECQQILADISSGGKTNTAAH